jgi:formate hydrogenlyase subunit 3/multisubunit Na+/H+ antiporter MnhD subunit
MEVLLVAMALQVCGGIAALALSKWPRVATVFGAAGSVAGCLIGLAATLNVFVTGRSDSLRLNWDASHGAFSVEVDSLSAFFLLPVLALATLAAIYGGDYLLAYRQKKSLGSPWFFFNVFVAGMMMVVLARTALLFLVAWEVMSVAAYCLVIFEHEKDEVRKAGWVYLVATHLGVAFLFLAFALLGRHAGSLEFDAFSGMPELSTGLAGLIFSLGVVGFGAKAGFVPFHVWLPEAHPAAPSHVSALMSGVMIKMGVYGILRFLTFLGPPAAWWGLVLAGLGLLTAFVGVSLALSQRDVKRILAYSSIENIGLIGLALGVGLSGRANNFPQVAVLGLTACLLHIWNHALMKGLMFLSAGSILHGTGSKDIEKLGGLMQRMPWTSTAMVVGAVAIAALPPLNGFVSEWLIYLGLLRSAFITSDARSLGSLFAVGLLALVGAIAAVVFVRLIGIVLLGAPRSDCARQAQESSRWIIGPILALVILCAVMSIVPQTVVASFTEVLAQLLGPQMRENLASLQLADAPLYVIGNLNILVLVVVGALTAATPAGERVESPSILLYAADFGH